MSAPTGIEKKYDPLIMQKFDDSLGDFHLTAASRILIAQEVNRQNLYEKWRSAVAQYLKDNNDVALQTAYGGIRGALVKIGINA